MKHLSLVIIVIVALTGLAACSKNKQLYKKANARFEQGDYDAATYLAAESLSLKPDYAKAQGILGQAYPRATQAHLDRISQLKLSDDDSNWVEIVHEYEALKSLHSAVRTLPPLRNPDSGQRISFDLRDYSAELSQARSNAAEYYYQKAIHQSRMDNSRASQKEAAGYFKTALSFVADYKDCRTRYETVRQKAITRIAILPFEDKSGSHDRYGAMADILADQIISRILQDQDNTEFLEIITRAQMDQLMQEQQLSASGLVDESSAARIGVLLGAQEILSGKILQVNYVPPRISTMELSETTNIEVEDQIDVRSEEKEVSCLMHKYTKTASLQILASYTVVDVSTGRINTQESFKATQTFEQSWGKIISGDSRALKPAQKALTNKSEPQAPTAKTMVNDALDQLSRDVVAHFFSYLK
jgi:TolB-like protein